MTSGDFVYLTSEGLWRNERLGFEILLHGDAHRPSLQHLVLLEQLLQQLEGLRERAVRYLDFWLHAERVGGSGADWYLESLELLGSAKEFALAFTLPSDPYGHWQVAFSSASDTFEPKQFSRQQQ